MTDQAHLPIVMGVEAFHEPSFVREGYGASGMTDLISLEAANARAALSYGKVPNPDVPNGIACPQCGKELVDNRPYVILPHYPPRLEIHCPACKWGGCRIHD